MATTSFPPAGLPFSGDPAADRLLTENPLALLIGFVLDQQVTVQTAFRGPLELSRRLGHLDPARIGALDPEALGAIFAERPALHRFPGTMARRVGELCRTVVEQYGGEAARIWTTATDAAELERRLRDLPGIGPTKAKVIVAVLAKRLGVRLPGWESVVPSYPTLGDVDSPEALAAYQASKRAARAAGRR
jgi:uncharacterized HhH-GPD family protein